MGLLQNGKWVDQWYDTKSNQGKFVRMDSSFRNWISPDGPFEAEAGRYHLYVSHACPWAHRTLIFRALKGLEYAISVSVVDWFMGADGWTFDASEPMIGATRLHQIYTAAELDYSGRVTVPVLWDKHLKTIVSNESADIIRMLNQSFDGVGARAGDYYPKALRDDIDRVNDRIYDTVNNGVYKAGFATSQEAYDAAIEPLFDTLAWLENRLGAQRYLVGNTVTEADWRLFTTLVRFDAVYVGHFKCNLKRIVDFPNLSGYVRDLYQTAGVAETVHMDHIKNHYYGSHTTINPTGIVPQGPKLDFKAAHHRSHLGES